MFFILLQSLLIFYNLVQQIYKKVFVVMRNQTLITFTIILIFLAKKNIF